MMTRLLAPLLVALLFAPVAFAQTGPCVVASWDANTETDLAGYHLTITEDGVARPVIPFASDAVTSACEPVGPSDYMLALTAFDVSGNESAPALKPFDRKPPLSPGNMQISVNVSVVLP